MASNICLAYFPKRIYGDNQLNSISLIKKHNNSNCSIKTKKIIKETLFRKKLVSLH